MTLVLLNVRNRDSRKLVEDSSSASVNPNDLFSAGTARVTNRNDYLYIIYIAYYLQVAPPRKIRGTGKAATRRIEEKRIKDNYVFLMKNLIVCLKKSDIITLGQFADAMKRAYGEQVLRNADFFSFFVNLCQKDEYQLGGDAGEDTFLDAYLGEGFKDMESFTFAIRKGLGGQVILSDNCMMADVELVRKEAHGE